MRPSDIGSVGSPDRTDDTWGVGESYPAWLIDLPKVELHVHLEGTVGPATLVGLAKRHGIDLGIRTLDDVQELYRYRNFAHFIENFVLISDCLRAPEDFGLIVEQYGRSLARQGAVYAEIHFNPEPPLPAAWRRSLRDAC